MHHVRSLSAVPRVDLYHFNSTEAEGSTLVLTSPRTLESCARLRVKPVDLPFKPLAEFTEENHVSTPGAATELLEERERRGEREKLVQEERKNHRKSPAKAFNCPETVLRSLESTHGSALKRPSEPGMTRVTADPVQSNSVSISRGSPGDERTRGLKFPAGLRLRDLRCSPATERKIQRLSEEINSKLNTAVPEKDRKLAALMLDKHEREECRVRHSELEEQHRENEKRQEEVRRASSEEKRRKGLLRRIRRWREDLEARRRRREEEETMLVGHREWETLKLEERRRRLAEERQTQRRSKREEASKEAKGRRGFQERLLKERRRGEEARGERELRMAREKEERAVTRKRVEEERARRRLEVENQRELRQHVSLKKALEEQRRTEEELKREELEQKLRRSEGNHALLVEARTQEVRDRGAREEAMARRAQQRAGRENGARMEQRQAHAHRCQLRTNHAVIQTQEKLRNRALGAREENRAKENTHRRLREKVLEEEKAQWEQRCRTVADKEERRERLRKEREEAQERRRRAALASCYMRERVREQISRRTFDQMAREAEMSAHLEHLKL